MTNSIACPTDLLIPYLGTVSLALKVPFTLQTVAHHPTLLYNFLEELSSLSFEVLISVISTPPLFCNSTPCQPRLADSRPPVTPACFPTNPSIWVPWPRVLLTYPGAGAR